MSEGGMSCFMKVSKKIEADPLLVNHWRRCVRGFVIDSAPGSFDYLSFAKSFDPSQGLAFYLIYFFARFFGIVLRTQITLFWSYINASSLDNVAAFIRPRTFQSTRHSSVASCLQAV